jgi:hypothetical protein
MSQRAIAKRLGISRTWVQVLEFSALNKLRVACGLEPRPMGPSMARTAGAHVAIGERTPYHCRRCGELGHNARRCGA